MREFFRSTRFKVFLGIVLLIFAGMVIAASSYNAGDPTSSFAGFLLSPIQRASRAVTDFFGDMFDFGSRSQSDQRIAELEQQVNDLQKEVVDYEKVKQQNEEYKKYLDLKEQNPDFQFEPAQVIARESDRMFHSFVINKGTLQGVEKNDPVISGNYLVGVIVEAGPTYATVVTLFSPDANVSAYEIETREAGFVTGTVELAAQGKCRMSNLSARDTAIKPGARICTAGMGGLYPPDLLIGTVDEVKNDAHDISAYAVITPAADIANLKDVSVLTSFKGQGEGADTPGLSSQGGH